MLHTPGDGQLLSAIYAALGRDFAKSLLEVDGGSGDVRASGFVSSPAAGHGTRARQRFFVNGRLVKSQLLTAAVEEVRAAEAAAMQGRKASVLLETPLSATMFTGYTKQYLPVLVSAPGHKTGDIVEVTLGAWDGKRCRAEIV